MPKGENQIVDLSGHRFGRLLVLSFHDVHKGNSRWLGRCDCGTEQVFYAHNLKNGNAQSCGCLRIERIKQANTTHGESDKTTEYKSWTAARDRCRTPSNKDWKNYGGRGIKFSIIWDDYSVFLAELGRKPTPRHQLDRIDNSKGYEPGNCRWATAKEQAANRRLMSINRLGRPIHRSPTRIG
jgi:hypothetical protein